MDSEVLKKLVEKKLESGEDADVVMDILTPKNRAIVCRELLRYGADPERILECLVEDNTHVQGVKDTPVTLAKELIDAGIDQKHLADTWAEKYSVSTYDAFVFVDAGGNKKLFLTKLSPYQLLKAAEYFVAREIYYEDIGYTASQLAQTAYYIALDSASSLRNLLTLGMDLRELCRMADGRGYRFRELAEFFLENGLAPRDIVATMLYIDDQLAVGFLRDNGFSGREILEVSRIHVDCCLKELRECGLSWEELIKETGLTIANFCYYINAGYTLSEREKSEIVDSVSVSGGYCKRLFQNLRYLVGPNSSRRTLERIVDIGYGAEGDFFYFVDDIQAVLEFLGLAENKGINVRPLLHRLPLDVRTNPKGYCELFVRNGVEEIDLKYVAKTYGHNEESLRSCLNAGLDPNEAIVVMRECDVKTNALVLAEYGADLKRLALIVADDPYVVQELKDAGYDLSYWDL